MALSKTRALPRAFWLLWCGQIVNRLGTLAPAFLILYLEQGRLVTSATTPLIVGLFGAGVLVSGLVGGAAADLFGGRRTIVAAQPAAAATALLFLVAPNVPALCALSLATGFLSAVDRPAAAGLISRIVPPEDFSRAYSFHMAGFNIGMSLGPVLAGFLLAVSPPALFWVWAGCALTYALLVCRLPGDERRPAATRDDGRKASPLREAVTGIAEPFRSPALVAFLLLTFVLACIYLQVNSALPLDMREKGMDPGETGLVLAFNAVLTIALLPLVPRVVRRMQDHTPLVFAAALFGIGFGLNALATGMNTFVTATLVWTLGEALWAPMSATFIARRAPERSVSTYQGSYFFAWNAAFVIGGPLGLTLANAAGFSALWLTTLLLGLAAAAAFLLVRRLPGFTLPREEPQPREDTSGDRLSGTPAP